MQDTAKPITSHASIIGIFISLTIILSIPLFIFASNEKQDIRQRASTEINNEVSDGGFLRGYIYIDENQNGTREYNEPGRNDINVEIAQTDINDTNSDIKNIMTTLVTDSNGYFRYDFAGITVGGQKNLNIDVLIKLPSGYKTINTNPIKFEGIGTNAKEIVEIGIFPILN